MLHAAYGPLPRRARTDPLDALVNTILSQNTSDVNSDRAFAALRAAFADWAAAAETAPRVIAECIRSGGLANVKSVRIIRVLQAIRAREGAVSLRRLRRMRTPAVMEYLLSLEGVGIKTACCVLLFALGRPVMPVDTHVFRVTRRLGWIGLDVPVDDVHTLLEPHIPPQLVLPLHLYLIEHGRHTCHPRNPACPTCCLAARCRARREGWASRA